MDRLQIILHQKIMQQMTNINKTIDILNQQIDQTIHMEYQK